MTSRRIFLASIPAGALALNMPNASAAVELAETDPTAVALGYKSDVKKVDTKKYPAAAAGQQCSNCKLYAGQATAPTAPCSIFANKLVKGKGWCVAWVKKV